MSEVDQQVHECLKMQIAKSWKCAKKHPKIFLFSSSFLCVFQHKRAFPSHLALWGILYYSDQHFVKWSSSCRIAESKDVSSRDTEKEPASSGDSSRVGVENEASIPSPRQHARHELSEAVSTTTTNIAVLSVMKFGLVYVIDTVDSPAIILVTFLVARRSHLCIWGRRRLCVTTAHTWERGVDSWDAIRTGYFAIARMAKKDHPICWLVFQHGSCSGLGRISPPCRWSPPRATWLHAEDWFVQHSWTTQDQKAPLIW